MSIRTNLIMHFHCSECGHQLTLAYSGEQAQKPIDGDHDRQIPKEPTGAACFYTPTVSINPCRNCIEKHTGPAKKLAEAIKALQE